MRSIDFCTAVKAAFEKQAETDPAALTSDINKFFLGELEKLISSDAADESLKMTRATVLFEGFYRHLNESALKKLLVGIRAHRWEAHFGTPTVPFLLSFKNQVDKTKQLFDEFPSMKVLEAGPPWLMEKTAEFMADSDNDIIADPTSVSRVAAPASREIMGIFTKTYNPFGGFTTAPCDPVSLKFIEHAATAAASGGKVLEIGAAFGAATLEALAKGVTVFCNDIDAENLAVVRKRYLEMTGDTTDSITGDSSKLVLVPGSLPDELVGLPPKAFDAILICRVLHFFTGAKIEESLALLISLLNDGGKIYIVCETPYLKNWQRFIPEFDSRVEHGVEWPGEITNPAEYESSGRAASLPKFVHWITKEVLMRSLLRAGFAVEHCEYIDRKGQFPDDLLLPEYGKESVGAVGIRGC